MIIAFEPAYDFDAPRLVDGDRDGWLEYVGRARADVPVHRRAFRDLLQRVRQADFFGHPHFTTVALHNARPQGFASHGEYALGCEGVEGNPIA